MDADANVRVVLEVFAAIEQRDIARFLAHTHPQVSICWPPSLPWNDGLPGRPDKHGHHARSWLEVWAPLQPTAAERQMHPEVIVAADAVKRFLADAQEQQPARRPSGPPGAGR